jgi:hypothetical protein
MIDLSTAQIIEWVEAWQVGCDFIGIDIERAYQRNGISPCIWDSPIAAVERPHGFVDPQWDR